MTQVTLDGTRRELSSTAVASTDPFAYVVAWLLGFVVACTGLFVIYTRVTGERPRESWSEVALGVTLIAAFLYALIRYRASRISFLLATGERSSAAIHVFRDVDQWVWMTLGYDRRGRAIERRILLASSMRTRALRGRETVTIATDPSSPRRLVVTDLYEE